jgi:Flp pilus assembly CpaF family ATPase
MSALDLIIQVARRGDQRRVCQIARIEGDGVREVVSW